MAIQAIIQTHKASYLLGKRSQLYLLAAVLLCMLLFVVSEGISKTNKPSRESYTLFRNIVSESPKVINSAIYSGRDVKEELDAFLSRFSDYSSTKNINVSLLYVLIYNNSMTISNNLGRKITVKSANGYQEVNDRASIDMSILRNILIEDGSTTFPFYINNNETQVKFIFIASDKKNNTEVYIYG